MKPIEGTIARMENGCLLQLIRFDYVNGVESWGWYMVVGVQGELPQYEKAFDYDAILKTIAEHFGVHCAPEGSGFGCRFANNPWIQFLGPAEGNVVKPRTLWISQSGGLDV